jgi:hypothetical protein
MAHLPCWLLQKYAELYPKYASQPKAWSRYSPDYGTNLAPKLFLQRGMRVLSRDSFWRLEAREISIL